MTTQQQDIAARPHTVEIHVNERPVHIVGPRVTGRQIKETAIAQGVPIELDFILSEELGDRRTKPVTDGDTVTVTAHSRFLAIPDDDNS